MSKGFYAESGIHADGTDRVLWGECTDCGVPFIHEGDWDNAFKNIDGDAFCQPCALIGEWEFNWLMARFQVAP